MRVPRWVHGPALAAAALLLPQTAIADIVDRLRLAEITAPERLRLRVQAAALSDGTLPGWGIGRMRRDMERQGYYASRAEVAIVATDLALAPTLSWDGNINGGVLQDRFVAGGLNFEAAPDVRAIGAGVAGVQAIARTRIAFDNGRLIELQGGMDVGYAPVPDLGRGDAQLGICGRNHVLGWTFLDFCGSRSYHWRDLIRGDATEISAEASRIFVSGRSAHQLGVSVARVSGGALRQDRVAVSVDSIWDPVATRAEFTLGREVPGQTALDYRVAGGASWLIAGRAHGVDLSQQVLDGGAFLGTPRRDVVHGLILSAEIRPGVELRLGLTDSRSTAAIAEYRQASIDLRFSGFR